MPSQNHLPALGNLIVALFAWFTLFSLSACSVIEWNRISGTSGYDKGYGVAVAKDGSVYITGITNGNFGGEINKLGRNYFLSKYNSTGKPIWTRLINGSPYEVSPLSVGPEKNAVAIGKKGEIYVVGRTKIALPGETKIGSEDGFIVCYDANGKIKWSDQFGKYNARTSAHGLFVDPDSGLVYVTGVTSGNLGSPAIATSNHSAFLTQYSGDGNYRKVMGQLLPAYKGVSIGYDIAKLAYHDILVAGATNTYVGPQNIDPPREAGGFNQTHASFSDVVLSTWDDAGSGINKFAIQYGRAGYDRAYSVASHRWANETQVYVTGNTGAGGLPAGSSPVPLNAEGTFLLKMHYIANQAYGKPKWIKYIPSKLGPTLSAVATDKAGDIYVTGSTDQSIYGQKKLGGADIMLSVYGDDGSHRYSYLLGTPASDLGNDIAVDSKGYIYIVGTTYGTAPYHFPTNAGQGDVFLMRIKPPSGYFTFK